MGNIKLLDCTLRDGGYINDWDFGEDTIVDTIEKLEKSRVDILEIGFFKDEPYQKNRTVYNEVSQLSKQIAPKKENMTYSAMIEVVNPLPLEQVAPCSEETVDFIRVIVWKTKRTPDGREVDALHEGFEYCKGIVAKGYKISVQPARVDQYSYDEFVAMVELFNELQPDIFYIVDSWGTQNAKSLMPYAQLAEEHLHPAGAIGYHGHNNMQQALDVAKAFCAFQTERDIYIDASIDGIGRGAGNLDTYTIAEYLNREYDKNYVLPYFWDLSERYIQPIRAKFPWGYSAAYYLTAIYNCNPNYGAYYDYDLHLPVDEIEGVIQSIPLEDRIIYSKKKAHAYLLAFRKKKWNKKLAIIIPTANRHRDIAYYLQERTNVCSLYGIDLIIYDSSDDDKTEWITRKYMAQKDSTVKYMRYRGYFDGVSIDEKVITAYRDLADEYEYLWACRDGHLINFWLIEKDLYGILSGKPDCVVVYDHGQNELGLPKLKSYTDCTKVLEDHCRHMAILGVSIFSAAFLKKVIEEFPVDQVTNYGLWQPIAMFQYWAKHPGPVVSYVNAMFSINAHATPSSFWNKKGRALWQWGERWCTMVEALPEEYQNSKHKIMEIRMADFTPFEPKQLVIMRANGSLTSSTYRQNQAYLSKVSHMVPWKFKCLCLVPKGICRLYLEHPNSPFEKGVKAIVHLLKKAYHAVKKPVSIIPPNFDLDKLRLSSSQPDLKFRPKQLCIIIPTHNRADIIQDHLNAVGALYCSYGVDVVIFDSSDREDTQAVVAEWTEKSHGAIQYYRFEGELDDASLDGKVMAAYDLFCDKYEYLWMNRDKCGINLNACAAELLKILEERPDMVSIHNQKDDYHGVGKKSYTNATELFKEQFNSMTTLGGTIVSGTFIRIVLTEIPLNPVKNYGLWQPVAFFQYIANHKFLAYSYSCDVNIYHPDALKGSFWMKQLLYQWVERFYFMFCNLPAGYTAEIPSVLLEWNRRYHLLDVTNLLTARSRGFLLPAEVEKNREWIPFVSTTPLAYYDRIAQMSPKKAEKTLRRIMDRHIYTGFTETDDSLLGCFHKGEETPKED